MTNKLNEKRSNKIIIAALVVTLIAAVIGLTVGMVCALMARSKRTEEPRIADFLLVDSAYGLMRSTSALRLCTEPETADEMAGFALVYAVRAETALECEGRDWRSVGEREAFLNDAAALLAESDSMKAVKKSADLYKFSAQFYSTATSGEEFAYNGELVDTDAPPEYVSPDDGSVKSAEEFVKKALKVEHCSYIGGFGDSLEFDIEDNGVSGYARVENGLISEFSFARSRSDATVDEESAKKIALAAAHTCGYDGLEVYSVEGGEPWTVKMCHKEKGAMCRDECASAVVEGNTAVAFSAGKCGNTHGALPKVKVSETEAHKAAPDADGEGMLVTTNDGTRDRVCYEYKYTLEDGVHFVYICAENGKQMRVK